MMSHVSINTRCNTWNIIMKILVFIVYLRLEMKNAMFPIKNFIISVFYSLPAGKINKWRDNHLKTIWFVFLLRIINIHFRTHKNGPINSFSYTIVHLMFPKLIYFFNIWNSFETTQIISVIYHFTFLTVLNENSRS